jgi:hypothetical protein
MMSVPARPKEQRAAANARYAGRRTIDGIVKNTVMGARMSRGVPSRKRGRPMPARAPVVAVCVLMGATCGTALAQPVDLQTPPQTPSAPSLAPGGPPPGTWPRLPLPPVPENDPPHAFLEAARSAVDQGQTGEAQEALERAETRLVDRAVMVNGTRGSDGERAVLDIGVTRQGLAARDRAGALLAINDALAASDPVARAAAPPPTIPPPAAVVTVHPPGPPSVTYALLPGHWQLHGTSHVWVPPETNLRRVEDRPFIEGRYVWRDGEWHWVPPHYGSN